MKTITAGITALTLLGTSPTFAQQDPNYLPVTGDDLVELIEGCDSGECFSFMSGVINGIGVYAHLTKNPYPFCSGEEVRSNEIRDAIIDVIEDTPRLGRAPAPAAILTAFSRNWPCTTSTADAVTNDIATNVDPENQITYADLDQVDMDVLLDFISRKTFVLNLGDPNAPLEKTLHVFDDPNCEYCDVLNDELDVLTSYGWRVLVYPISIVSEDSKGFAALQYAVRDSASSAPIDLYRSNLSEGEKTITEAMNIAQESGMSMPDILNLLASSNPYQAIEANNQAYEALGATDVPTWILGDRIASGITEASEILRIQETMNISPKSADLRPGLKAGE